jgi:GNAT superfamily N-acetyltransferase
MWLMGPYLQMLALLPPFQRQGIGTRVVAWFERKRGSRRAMPGCA